MKETGGGSSSSRLPLFAAALACQIAAAKARAHESPLSMIALMVREERLDAVVIKPQWCVPPAAAPKAGSGGSGGRSSEEPAALPPLAAGVASHKADWHR